MSKHSKKMEAVIRSPVDLHVLVVDDEEDVTEVLAQALTRNGYLVTVYNSPVKAMQSFRPGMFDLAIIDVRMPEINGFQLLKRFKAIDKNLKVCLITAFELVEEDLIGNDLAPNNIECFMKKPILLSEFIKKVTTLLEGC
jgi:two-component system OmpR family response regulator